MDTARIMRPLLACFLILVPLAAAARVPLPQKFSVRNDVLVFDAENGVEANRMKSPLRISAPESRRIPSGKSAST